jgi:hypothetical protein
MVFFHTKNFSLGTFGLGMENVATVSVPIDYYMEFLVIFMAISQLFG